MGMIRKTLAVGSGGVVRGSSKKQRNAKETIRQLEIANLIASGLSYQEAERQASLPRWLR